MSDLNNTTLTGATIKFTAGFANTEDRLLFTNQNGISGSYNTSTGILTLSGTDPGGLSGGVALHPIPGH